MQSIEVKGLDGLIANLEGLLKEIPEARKELHEKIASAVKAEVETQITNSGLNDSSGKVKEWQEPSVGSGGGYAAVRAEKGKTGDNSPGAITNYLEGGHKIREPSGNARNYRPRVKTPYVEGYHFYERASSNAENTAIAEAEKYADELTKKLGG